MKRITSLLFAALIIVCSCISSPAEDLSDLVLSSHGVYLFNTDTDSVVFERGGNSRMYPASLTKMVTALTVLTDCDDLSEKIVSPALSYYADVYEEGGSNIKLKEGEELTVEQLLYALILPSACDVATDLAYHFGSGDPQKFYDRMNEVAAEAGATDSHFVNAHGLHNDEHFTTPHDMAVILQKLLTYDIFNTIINTVNYTIPATNMSEARNVSYTIEMLNSASDKYYPYMKGVKSGFTNYAGRCLVSTAEKDGYHYLLVLMGANLNENVDENLAYSDTRKIYDYAFSNCEKQEVVEAGKTLTSVKVNGGEKEKIDLVADSTITAIVDKNEKLTYEFSNVPESLDAPVDSGEVGTVTVKSGEREIATLKLFPATDDVVEAIANADDNTTTSDVTLGEIAGDRWLDILVIVLIAIFAFIVAFILVARSHHRKQARKKRAKRYINK